MHRPQNLTIDNWREHPNNRWAFQHVRQIIPTATIRAGHTRRLLETRFQDIGSLQVDSNVGQIEFVELLKASHTDGLVVLHHGDMVYQWHADYYDMSNPHIVFSISKSITAMLAGILEAQGLIDCEAPVVDYVSGVRGSVYGNCTIRNLLDMTVALDFEENYSDKESEYMRYREATGWNAVDQTGGPADLESFLYSLRQSEAPHGDTFLYRSPNSDLLGLLIERVAAEPLATLFSKYLWQPMGAVGDGYVTVDRLGLARAAGGVCIHPIDLAGIGQMFLNDGKVGDQQVIPVSWIADTRFNGDKGSWSRGDYHHKYPNGRYRNKWYQAGNNDGVIGGRGIHGQILYINPRRKVVIAKLTSQPTPLDDVMTARVLKAFDAVSEALSG